MKSTSLWLFGGASLGLAALASLACTPQKVNIAAVLPLTGEFSAYGQSIRKGMELAYEEIQKDGTMKPPVVLMPPADSGGDPAKAAELLEKAYKGDAIASIGGVTSAEAKAMIPVLDSYEKIMISPSASSPELSGASRNFYRIWPSDHSEATKMAQSAFSDLNVKTVVVICEEQLYAKGTQAAFKPAFETLGGKILEIIDFPPNTSDMSALVSRAISLAPQAIYLIDYADGIGAMIQELRRQKYDGRILTTSAFSTATALAKVGQNAAGVYLTQSVFDPSSDFTHIRKFVDGYKAKYGERPDIYAAHGYDAMHIIAEGFRGRATLPSELKKGLRDAIKDYPGVTGSVQFDEKGDVKKFPRLYLVTGELMLVDYNDEARRIKEEIDKRRKELEDKIRAAQAGL